MEENNNKKIYKTLYEAIARAEFEGFIYIVKTNMDDIEKLRNNLTIYEELMIKDLIENVEGKWAVKNGTHCKIYC